MSVSLAGVLPASKPDATKRRLIVLKGLIGAALVAIPVTIGSFVYATTQPKASEGATDSYTCPVTGEELPCPNCCPLNK